MIADTTHFDNTHRNRASLHDGEDEEDTDVEAEAGEDDGEQHESGELSIDGAGYPAAVDGGAEDDAEPGQSEDEDDDDDDDDDGELDIAATLSRDPTALLDAGAEDEEDDGELVGLYFFISI